MPKQNFKEKIEQEIILERLTNHIETNTKENKAILEQVLKTNGAIEKHNERLRQLEKWRNLSVGGLIIVNLFIVPILFWLIYKHLNGI